jgi:glyoxylase-like metal-dependent hydrolase (beta-lactamase superfamily II)
MDFSKLDIHTLIVGQKIGFWTNCYIVSKNSKCIIIDPGDDGEIIESKIKNYNLTPIMIICTHTHIDHTKDAEYLQKKFKIPVLIHKNEVMVLQDQSIPKLFGLNPVKFDYKFIKNEIKFEGEIFKIINTPGHTIGSIVIINNEQKIIFSGDLIFKNGIGRTDLFTGNENELKDSIKKILELLSDDYTIYPGHGEITKLGVEREFLLNFINS